MSERRVCTNLQIIKLGKEPVEVQQAAQAVFDDLFKSFHNYINHIHCGLVRELYADMGYVAYVINFYVEAPADVVFTIAERCPDDRQAMREAEELARHETEAEEASQASEKADEATRKGSS